MQANGVTLGDLADVVTDRIEQWSRTDFVERMWGGDHTLWADDPSEITNRLGWLTLPETMASHLPGITGFAAEVAGEGCEHVVLLGMGGSSLAPEVWQRTFGSAPGHPELIVLDSTHPGAILDVAGRSDLATTLFLVSSKSGTTVEPLSMFRWFWHQLASSGIDPGPHFAAVTDPGSQLELLARDRGFRRVFTADPDVGGRYSALTHFGLVPAALIGADVAGLVDAAAAVAHVTSPRTPPKTNPALLLGAALGEAASAGRDKATYVTSPALAAFPDWVEQLVAESTGKDGTGIVPVAGEPLGPPDVYRNDRFFVYVGLRGDEQPGQLERLATLEARGHPVSRHVVSDRYDLAGLMYEAEMAIAAAGAVLGIQPFDQPDVQRAKELARQAMEGELDAGGVEEVDATHSGTLDGAADAWLAAYRPGDYVSIQAYINPTADADGVLQRLRLALRDRLRAATTLGYGPRFLHSTGQLHKGGADTGLFLQLVDDPADQLPVPEADYSFAGLIAGQALGDYQALRDEGRRVLRVQLGKDSAAGLEAVEAVLG